MTLQADRLMPQATGQPKFPLPAESETKFFLKGVDAKVGFFRNEKDDVTHIILHQGRQDLKGTNK